MTSSKGRFFPIPAVQCFPVDVLRQLEGGKGTGEASKKSSLAAMGSVLGRSNVISGSVDASPPLTRVLFQDQTVLGII